MNRIFQLLIVLMLSLSSAAQFYLRGEVRDEQGRPVSNARIKFFSKGNFPYYTGAGGAFGVPTTLKIDTITIIADGYETFTAPVRSATYEVFTLKMTALKANSTKQRLASLTKNLLAQKRQQQLDIGESYSSTVENDFVITGKYPETGYALTVDRASYSNIRRFLNQGERVPADAVRIEEMLNYFNFGGKQNVEPGQNFAVTTNITSCPWNDKSALLYINLRAKKISLDKTPPSNLVFLIDISGSMDMPNRLPLLKTGFKLLVENLRSIDTVSIITYASGVSIMLQPTSGAEKQKIIEALEGLTPAGATSGEAAIATAYRYATKTFIRGGNNRVILATDGDFNVGVTSERELEELIAKHRQTGIYLTCLGVGMGNYKDSKLEALAKKGNGNFAYLDNEHEAEKVLVEEFAQTVFTVANNVFMNVEFNPALVRQYRLIGFDNKQSAIEDSVSSLEGGEVGSGHSLLSVFEILPDSALFRSVNQQVATLKLTYSIPGNADTRADVFKVLTNYKPIMSADSSLRFATALVMFGSILKQSGYLKDVSIEDVQQLAATAVSPNDRLQLEFAGLVQKAKRLYPKRKQRR
ncbi:DUF3520 domain-containing protein [Segetibacter sp. 3557_3]|uniref:YfbK domain-containing protein n=1 Tax=Segetibacter sp. 3557_3 TaxID=2547429 RepID=UPI001058E7B5|nr:von Willebrand factor type A domain-containing protein [Segetibacter sp. 3557_3]TDH27870.1 DUF3520 domain-containing protein [Segetibacter sp. 3557_3]